MSNPSDLLLPLRRLGIVVARVWFRCSLTVAALFAVAGTGIAAPRTLISFNHDWLFYGGEHDSAQYPETPDQHWRLLRLPHDWAIEGEFDPSADARTGSLPSHGTGWYRKHFSLPLSTRGKVVTLRFDGAMSHAQVWVNGHYLGERAHGYAGFEYDISRQLQYGEQFDNIVAVKLSPPAFGSRGYPGAGLYRKVWLRTTPPIHIPSDGVILTTPTITAASATVALLTQVINSRDEPGNLTVEHRIWDPQGQLVAQSAEPLSIAARAERESNQNLRVSFPQLWAPDHPSLYRAVTVVSRAGEVVDQVETSFGIRSVEFSAEAGFRLNGNPTKIKGVCLQHDLPGLGAAVNRAALTRQLRLLKETGVNTLRTGHIPPAPELLELGDELGLLLQVDVFDGCRTSTAPDDHARHFPHGHECDLRTVVRRARNHPSVFRWRIGNDSLAQTDPSAGPEIVRELTAICHEEDPTRPIFAGLDHLDEPSSCDPECLRVAPSAPSFPPAN